MLEPKETAPIAGGLDPGWWQALLATAILCGLIGGAIGDDLEYAAGGMAAGLAVVAALMAMFGNGLHFSLTVATGLAAYACVFSVFRAANFHAASPPFVLAGFALPILGFLAGCLWRRARIAEALRIRQRHEMTHLPRVTRWLPAVSAIGLASFAVPRFPLTGQHPGLSLLAAAALIAGVLAYAARDLMLLLMDVSMVFETLGARMHRLVMPIMAFLSFYGLLVMIFACFYRLIDVLQPMPQFVIHGQPAPLTFANALYFSVITVATVGYGDIAPLGAMVRALSALEVVAGVLLLLFGFSEIMRDGGGPARPTDADRRKARNRL